MKRTKTIVTALLAALLLASCGTNDLPNTSSGTSTYHTGTHQSPVSVPEQENLSARFAQTIDRIVITNGTTGARMTLTDPSEIERIIAFCEPIVGTAPESNRGYYGFYYSITLYNGAAQLDHISFMNENLPGEAAYAVGHYETVNGHDYAIRYRMVGRSTNEVRAFFGQYLPCDTEEVSSETTANHVGGTAQSPEESEPQTDGFDYSTLTLPNYAAENPKRYLGVTPRGENTDGWQDFGKTGEICTIPVPMGSTYTYQTYSYYIRNDLTHLYPNDTLPQGTHALAEWLADTTADGRRAFWYSMSGTLPNKIEILSCEDIAPEGGGHIEKVTYLVNEGERERTWVVYFLGEEDGTLSALSIRPNEEGDYVFSFTDTIAKSYRPRAGA